MTGAFTAIVAAVVGTSLICLVLMVRAERYRNRRRAAADGSGSDGAAPVSHFWSWFGGDNSALDHSGHSDGSVGSHSGGGDTGGGDSGGGGGDGGGGVD
jgi:hypothetical protein